MNHSIPHLQIKIHKLDGSASTYMQDDVDKSKRILDEFNPMEIFGQKKIFPGDESPHTAISAGQITQIDLESGESPHLLFQGGVVEAVELSRQEFEELVQNLSLQEQWECLGEEDAFVVAFLNIAMADGRRVLLTMEVDAQSSPGLSELRDFILSRPALCFRMRSGGVSVLNLANLAQLTFFPGTLQPCPDAWAVRALDLAPALDEREGTELPMPAGAPAPLREKLSLRA
jgi:hypothetical protein